MDPRKIRALLDYYAHLQDLFYEGKLEGKISVLLGVKAKELGFSVRTFWRRTKLQ